MPTIKGTASVADSRARQKALKKTKFPRNFGKSVSLEKVNKPVLTQWIEQKVTSILGFEDEIVSSTAINLFLPSDNTAPDPRKAQLDLAGFLGEQAVTFSVELWKLMLEAQASTSGIPQSLVEQKKKEMTERMTKDNQGRQEKGGTERVNRFSQMNQFEGKGQNRNDNDRNHPPSELHVPSHSSPSKREDKFSKNASAPEHPPSQRDKSRNIRKENTAGRDIDQFGRAYPPQRPRNMQRYDPREQNDHYWPRSSEGSRRSQYRSRSRERYDHDRERGPGHRRRSGDRYRDDTRRFDDRRYDSNRYDDRSNHHHQYHRHHDDYHDHNRYRDGEGRRNRHYDYDREMDGLERRLDQLKKQYSGRDKKTENRAMHRIEDEMADIQDRIYELERYRRRYNSSRDDRRVRNRRSRSSSYEYRRGSRRKRSNSSNTERSDSVRSRRDDYSTDSAGSDRGSKSYSPSPERTKRNKGSGSPKRQKRRRSRSRSRSISSSEGSEQSS